MNRNNQIDWSDTDRIVSNDTRYVQLAGDWWRESSSWQTRQNGSPALTRVGLTRTRLTGHDGRARTPAAPQGSLLSETHSCDPLNNVTISCTYLDRSSHTTTQTTLSPDSTLPAEVVVQSGLTVSSRSSTGVTTTYAYDALGRQISQTDGRGNTSQIVYDAQGRVAKTIDALGHETTYAYDALGRQTSITDPLGHTVTTIYDAEGRVLAQRGATYPVDYAYDAYGNKVSMTTYRNESDVPMVGGDVPGAPHAGDTTRWLYDEPSGCMTNKLYADGKGPAYSYTPDGKLARRTWARGVATDYTYDNAGNLTRTEYNDNVVTPTITMSYDRVGKLTEATTAGVVTNLYAYDIVGHCTNEWQNDFNLTRYYDTLGRSTGYAVNGTRQTTIAYDTYGRIATMCMSEGRSGVPTASNENEFVWSYMPNTDLKASLLYPNGLTASWTYDANNQLLQVRNATPTNVISQFDYTYDAAGRRVSIAKTGSAFGDLSGSVDTFTYNARSELTSARRTKNGQPIPGFSEDFDYDPIGNRRSSATYNEKGEAQTSTYQANNLNQYTSRTSPGYAAVRGEADPEATVTVNENPTFRLGSYYFGSDLFDNSTAGGLAALETYATLAQTVENGEEAEDLVSATTNQVYLTQSPETFAYDDDGNQTLITTKTGLWRVTYNGENRPILWVRDSDNTTLTMSYDHMGRRRQKNDQRFFYEGYLQVADNCGNVFAWDCTEPIATRPLAWFRDDFFGYYYAHDGNKNVSEVISADGMLAAHYDYAPFGVTIAHCGKSAAINPWRFSCECVDDETENVYYMSRHYDPILGRWIARDPIGERGPSALYVFCENRNGCFDVLGMWSSVIIETHQNMVRKAATNVFPLYPRLNNLLGVVKDSIVGLISKGNCRMDSVYSADLALHYNRAYDKTEVQDLKVEQNNVEKAKRQYGKGLSERRKTIGKLLNIGDSYLSDTECENVLLYIGEITHMVQDYYGHGVDSQYRFLGTVTINTGRNVMDMPRMSGSIGQYTGSSSNPTMKPSSYASATEYSEHGPIWWREPGYRAPDTKGRYDASVFETENELMKYMGKWCDKCCPYIERMQESVRAAYRSYAAAYGYEL